MLDFLRKRRRSWIVIFLLGTIVVVFILWGVGSYVTRPGLETLVEVNGDVISQREFEVHFQRLVEFYRDLFKGGLTQEAIRSLNLRSVVVEELIQNRLLLQEARRLRIEASDEELMDAISRVPQFLVNGRFNKKRYLQALSSSRMTPGQFETERREQLTIQKLYDIILDAVHVTEAEARERYRLEQEKVVLYFIRLSAGNFVPEVKVTSEEIKNHYERNREALKEPLRVQVEYLTYPFGHFSAKVQVSGKEIEDYYQLYRETKFHQAKAVRLRHILFRVPAGVEIQQKEMVRLKAEGVLREARAAKDFADAAKRYSEDPSGAQGGDAGWFNQGQMLPALDKVAFSLKKGEISNLVESSLGYHILKVDETKEGKIKSLREATEEIVNAIKAERGRIEAAKAVDADREKVISGTELSLVANERGIPLRVSPFFSRFEVLPEVGSVEEFNKAVFSLALKELSPAVEGPSAYYLLRVKERKEPSVPPFDRVSADIERKLKETKALELANEKANALLTQLKKEKDIKKLAKEHGLRLEETGWFFRNASEIPKIGPLQEVKPAGIPVSSYQPVADRFYTQGASVYLLAFKESQGADMDRFEKEKERFQEQALAEKRQKGLQTFVDSLKAKARISMKTDLLEQG